MTPTETAIPEEATADEAPPEKTKLCPDCGFPRPLSEFYRVKAARYAGGYRYTAHCKEHTQIRGMEYRRNAPKESGTKQSQKRAQRNWERRNPEQARVRRERYVEANREKVNKYNNAWQKAHPEKHRERQRRYLARKKARELGYIESALREDEPTSD